MADPTPGNTTIGVEIECILICPLEDCYTMAEKHDFYFGTAPSLMIHQTLSEPQLTDCWVTGCTEHHLRHLPLASFKDENEWSLEEPEAVEGDFRAQYSKWIVDSDSSLGLTEAEKKACPYLKDEHYLAKIEIKSRILNFNKPTPCPGLRQPHDEEYDWKFELQHVLDKLHSNFNNPSRPGYRLIVNATCGGHVHVGGSPPDALPQISRGVMSMYTAFERHIDRLLAINRISAYRPNPYLPIEGVDKGREYDYPGSDNILLTHLNGIYSVAISAVHLYRINKLVTSSVTAGNKPQQGESSDVSLKYAQFRLHAPAWIYTIMACNDMRELDNLWDRHDLTGHMTAINLENIPVAKNDFELKSTVEFRAHPGTLDANEWIAWVDVCARMVKTSAEASRKELTEYLLDKWADPDFTIFNLLRDLRTSSETQALYNDMINNEYALKRRDMRRQIEQMYGEDSLKALMHCNGNENYESKRQHHIDEKIRRKLEKGLYGYKLIMNSSDDVLEPHGLLASPETSAHLLADKP